MSSFDWEYVTTRKSSPGWVSQLVRAYLKVADSTPSQGADEKQQRTHK